MARPDVIPGLPRLITLAAVGVVTLSLYWAKDVLMPLSLGLLFSFLLAPLVTRVEKLGAGRILAVAIVSLCAFVAVGATTYFVFRQLVDLAEALPHYRENIHQRVEAFRQRPSPISKAAKSIEVISQELATSQPASGPAPIREDVPETTHRLALTQARPAEPVPVTIVERSSQPLMQARDTLGWIIGPLGQAAVVIILVIFMLLQREDLRDRLIYLLGRGHINLTTQALDDASNRISRYLLMQLIVNVSYGVPVAIGLWLLGLPNALVWGMLATLLRYLPYVGPWVAASLPVILSLAISTGWWQPVAVIGLFVGLELISNNVMEPWLYGASTGMSSVAIILAAVFWAWLWGPVGLLLATPMTVCLVVAGKYVQQLEFLNVLLGDEPVWDLCSRFYQRLLAQDDDEATEMVEDYLKGSSLVAAYDDVVLPALHMAERDRHRGVLDLEREEFVRQAIKGLIDDLEEFKGPTETPAEQTSGAPLPNGATSSNGKATTKPANSASPPPEVPSNLPHVLCVPARDAADELAGEILVQVLRKAGYPATIFPLESLASEALEQVEQSGTQIVCISALPPAASAHARYLCKRLRGRFSKIKLMVGLWDVGGDLSKARERLLCIGSDKVVRTVREALDEIRQFNIVEPQSLSNATAGTPL